MIVQKKIFNTHVSIAAMPVLVDSSVLQEFVRRLMEEKGLKPGDVARRARQKGHPINDTYVGKIRNGKAGHVTIPMAQALAAGLDTDEDALFDLLRGVKRPEGFRESRFWKLFEAYERLSDPVDRAQIESYVEKIQAATEVVFRIEDDRRQRKQR